MKPIEQFFVDLGDGVQREVRFNNRVCRKIYEQTKRSVVRGELWATFTEADFPIVLLEALVDKTGITPELIDELHPSVVAEVTSSLIEAFNGEKSPEKTDVEQPEKN